MLALLYDVDGNLPAFAAVLADAREHADPDHWLMVATRSRSAPGRRRR